MTVFDYLVGYSMVIAKNKTDILTILGAPRYQHIGAVDVVLKRKLQKRIHPEESQVVMAKHASFATLKDSNKHKMIHLPNHLCL